MALHRTHLEIEKNLAYAHRALNRARDEASNLADLGLHDDLQLFLIDLERLQEDTLRRRKHPSSTVRRRTYLSSLLGDDRSSVAR